MAGGRSVIGAILVDTLGTGMFMSLVLLYLVEARNLDSGLAGTTLSVAALLSFLFLSPIARYIKRADGRSGLILASITSVVGYVCYLVTPNIAVLFFGAALVYFGDRLHAAAWPVAAIQYFGKTALARLFAAVNTVKTVALGIGALSAAGALSVFGSSGLMWLLGVNICSYVAAAILLLSAPRAAHAKPSESSREQELKSVGVLHTLKVASFRRLLVSQAALSFIWVLPGLALPLYLSQSLGAPASIGVAALAVRYGTVAIAQLPAVAIFEHRSRAVILIVSASAALAGLTVLVILPFVETYLLLPMTVFAVVLMAGSEIVSKPTAAAEAAQIAPEGDEASYMSMFQVSWTLAYALGPGIVGVGLGRPWILWVLLSAIILAGTIYGIRGNVSTSRRKQDEPIH